MLAVFFLFVFFCVPPSALVCKHRSMLISWQHCRAAVSSPACCDLLNLAPSPTCPLNPSGSQSDGIICSSSARYTSALVSTFKSMLKPYTKFDTLISENKCNISPEDQLALHDLTRMAKKNHFTSPVIFFFLQKHPQKNNMTRLPSN